MTVFPPVVSEVEIGVAGREGDGADGVPEAAENAGGEGESGPSIVTGGGAPGIGAGTGVVGAGTDAGTAAGGENGTTSTTRKVSTAPGLSKVSNTGTSGGVVKGEDGGAGNNFPVPVSGVNCVASCISGSPSTGAGVESVAFNTAPVSKDACPDVTAG